MTRWRSPSRIRSVREAESVPSPRSPTLSRKRHRENAAIDRGIRLIGDAHTADSGEGRPAATGRTPKTHAARERAARFRAALDATIAPDPPRGRGDRDRRRAQDPALARDRLRPGLLARASAGRTGAGAMADTGHRRKVMITGGCVARGASRSRRTVTSGWCRQGEGRGQGGSKGPRSGRRARRQWRRPGAAPGGSECPHPGRRGCESDPLRL